MRRVRRLRTAEVLVDRAASFSGRAAVDAEYVRVMACANAQLAEGTPQGDAQAARLFCEACEAAPRRRGRGDLRRRARPDEVRSRQRRTLSGSRRRGHAAASARPALSRQPRRAAPSAAESSARRAAWRAASASSSSRASWRAPSPRPTAPRCWSRRSPAAAPSACATRPQCRRRSPQPVNAWAHALARRRHHHRRSDGALIDQRAAVALCGGASKCGRRPRRARAATGGALGDRMGRQQQGRAVKMRRRELRAKQPGVPAGVAAGQGGAARACGALSNLGALCMQDEEAGGTLRAAAGGHRRGARHGRAGLQWRPGGGDGDDGSAGSTGLRAARGAGGSGPGDRPTERAILTNLINAGLPPEAGARRARPRWARAPRRRASGAPTPAAPADAVAAAAADLAALGSPAGDELGRPRRHDARAPSAWSRSPTGATTRPTPTASRGWCCRGTCSTAGASTSGRGAAPAAPSASAASLTSGWTRGR